MIRAKYSPESENLAKSSQGCKMFHVEQRSDSGNQALEDELFHVEHSPLLLDGPGRSCFTWNAHNSVPAQCDSFAPFWILKDRAAAFQG